MQTTASPSRTAKAEMSRPAPATAKPGKKAPSKNPSSAKPLPAISRNPLKELNNGDFPPSVSSRGSKGRCFGFLLPSSSSSVSSAASSSSSASSRQRSHHGTTKALPLGTRHLGATSNRGEDPGLRSRTTQKKVPRVEKHGLGNLKPSRTDDQPKPTSRFVSQHRFTGRTGSDRLSSLKDEEGRSRSDGVGKPRVGSKGCSSKHNVRPGDGVLRDVISEVPLGFDLGGAGVSQNEIPHGSILDAMPAKKGEEQLSHTPKSTRTATPPVQASISPELGAQSAVPTPACFAAGHLIAGVQDRRKCRPRGILNGGIADIAGGKSLGSSDASGSGCCGSSLTPPLPVKASVHWLSSPHGGESGNLRSNAFSSSTKKIDRGAYPPEASMNLFLSPVEDKTDAYVLDDVLIAATGVTDDSPEFISSSMNLSNLEYTPSAVEICHSPTTNSTVSPFSMIIKNATGSVRCKNRDSQDKGKHHYGSSVRISPFSGNSHGNRNVILTPSSCSCSSRQAQPIFTFDLHDTGERSEISNSSSPLWKLLAMESEELPSSSSPRILSGNFPAPSNSLSLACFRRPWCHQSTEEGELSTKEGTSSSKIRISWREGLISQIFEMDEFNHNSWSSKKEDTDYHGDDELILRPEKRFDQNIGSSMSKVGDQCTTNGFGSFEFVGLKQTEQQGERKHSSAIQISCAESLSMHMDGLVASDDSDWKLFFRNNLFEL